MQDLINPVAEGISSPDLDPAAVIALQDVWKIYDTGEIRVEALRGVSLEIARGEFVAIMGASGSGKSTMLNILGCLDHPTSGVYRLDGVDVSTFSNSQRADIRNQKIGFIFQTFNLLSRTSVWENVEAPMLYSGTSKTERIHRIEEALSVVGLSEKAKALPNQLSGGQQQRVAAARALVNQPAILLADEPTGNLDPEMAEETMRLFARIHRQGTTVLIATHDHRFLQRFDGRVLMMRQGRLTSIHGTVRAASAP
jgi:putative ABC transport system ATP-binding protein